MITSLKTGKWTDILLGVLFIDAVIRCLSRENSTLRLFATVGPCVLRRDSCGRLLEPKTFAGPGICSRRELLMLYETSENPLNALGTHERSSPYSGALGERCVMPCGSGRNGGVEAIKQYMLSGYR